MIAPNPLDGNQSVSNIQIDWQQYFRDFCALHGKYPVLYQEDWFLFPDGYRYSATDYSGPELPPPTNVLELRALQLFYWERRRRIVRLEYRKVESTLEELKDLTAARSAPLSHRLYYRDDEGKTVSSIERVEFDSIERRLRWLANDVKECTRQLETLKLGA